MCWNSPISIVTFIIEVTICIYLFRRNKNFDRMNSIFILSFSLIQLLEGFIWLGVSDKCEYNGFVSLIPIALWLQPLAQSYGLYYVYKNNKDLGRLIDVKYIPIILMFLYMIFFVYSIFKNKKSVVTIGEHKHLNWNCGQAILDNSLMIFVYLFGILFPLFLTKKWKLIFLGLITLIYSLYNYSRSKESSSFWCFLGLLYAIVAVFQN